MISQTLIPRKPFFFFKGQPEAKLVEINARLDTITNYSGDASVKMRDVFTSKSTLF